MFSVAAGARRLTLVRLSEEMGLYELDGRVPHVGEGAYVSPAAHVIGDVRIGFEICEDAWVATRPGAYLARRAVDVILNPSASHFAFGKLEVRKRFVLEGSRAFARRRTGCVWCWC